MSKLEAVIFDWSGTLVDDFDKVHDAFNATCRYFGGRGLTSEEYRRHNTVDFTTLYELGGCGRRTVEELQPVYDHMYGKSRSRIRIIPGSLEAVTRSKEYSDKIILVSVQPLKFLEKEVEMLGFNSHFDKVYGGNPDKTFVFSQIFENGNGGCSFIVGDTVSDINAGKKVGIITIAVAHPYSYHVMDGDFSKLEKAKPDYLIHNIADLPEVVKNHLGAGGS